MVDLSSHWYRSSLHWRVWLLLPFTWIFNLIITIRRMLYRVKIFKTTHFPVPVIVVGNLTVGGTGKTPLVIELANFLQSQGYSPGIVSRGCGGQRQVKPVWVLPPSNVKQVGDEALLLARRTQCPVVISIDRVAAVKALLHQSSCDVVISDDGLQHYRMGREIEIVMVDSVRGFGNHHLLPTGPLREPITRLNEVDFVVTTNGNPKSNKLTMTLVPDKLISLINFETRDLIQFKHEKIHAVAGIGHPERFFTTLRQAGLNIIPHVFPDHHHYVESDLDFHDNYPILMTEKDAVKCKEFMNKRCWYLTVVASIEPIFKQQLLLKLQLWENQDELKKKLVSPISDSSTIQHNPIRE